MYISASIRKAENIIRHFIFQQAYFTWLSYMHMYFQILSTVLITGLLTGCAGAGGPHNSIKPTKSHTILKNPCNSGQYWSAKCVAFLKIDIFMFITKIFRTLQCKCFLGHNSFPKTPCFLFHRTALMNGHEKQLQDVLCSFAWSWALVSSFSFAGLIVTIVC